MLTCFHLIKMNSSTSLSNSTSPIKNLNIIEKYSFRGRRKYDSTAASKVVDKPMESRTKQQKLCGNKQGSCESILIPEIKSEVQTIDSDTNNSAELENNMLTEHRNASDKNKIVGGCKTKKIVKKKKISKTESVEEVDIEDCEKVKWMPKNWEEMLRNIQEMRKDQTAPVDDMGCHKTMDQDAPPKVKRYQALVSLMLSSQTKDQITYAVMLKLREHGLTVENILKTDEDNLAQLIKTVGFWRTKAKYIKRTTQILKDDYDGDIPDSVDKMLLLPGVGPKMANLCMTTAWGKVHGIGVDTHVHRISNRLQWVKKPTNTPERTRIALESWLPPALWFEVNHLMVGFGQQICLPRNPKCGKCINNKICPFGKVELRRKKKKVSS